METTGIASVVFLLSLYRLRKKSSGISFPAHVRAVFVFIIWKKKSRPCDGFFIAYLLQVRGFVVSLFYEKQTDI